MTFNFLRPGLTVNVEAKVQEQIILDSSEFLICFYRLILAVRSPGRSSGRICIP
jgi:hypothetical protein